MRRLSHSSSLKVVLLFCGLVGFLHVVMLIGIPHDTTNPVESSGCQCPQKPSSECPVHATDSPTRLTIFQTWDTKNQQINSRDTESHQDNFKVTGNHQDISRVSENKNYAKEHLRDTENNLFQQNIEKRIRYLEDRLKQNHGSENHADELQGHPGLRKEDLEMIETYDKDPRDILKGSQRKRKGLIIVGLSRSGTSFISQMFNADPEIFNVYEPLQIPNHWRGTIEKGSSYKKVATQTMAAIMTCNFTISKSTRRFLNEFSTNKRYRMQSNAFSSPPLCKQKYVYESCREMIPEELNTICKKQYKASVIKVTYARLPVEAHIESLFDILRDNLDFDLKILHIVRDPRGNYDSRIRLGWLSDVPNPRLKSDAEVICKLVEGNVRVGKVLDEWMRERYKMITYTEFYSQPLVKAQEIYKFAGFVLPESVKNWIIRSTNPPQEEILRLAKNPMALVRNSTANVEKWKQAPIERLQALEESCKSLIQLLGHEFVAT